MKSMTRILTIVITLSTNSCNTSYDSEKLKKDRDHEKDQKWEVWHERLKIEKENRLIKSLLSSSIVVEDSLFLLTSEYTGRDPLVNNDSFIFCNEGGFSPANENQLKKLVTFLNDQSHDDRHYLKDGVLKTKKWGGEDYGKIACVKMFDN